MCGNNRDQSQSDTSTTEPNLSSELDIAIGDPLENNIDPFVMMDHENCDEPHAEPLTNSDIRKNSACFLLQLREANGLSQVAVDTVIEGCEKLVGECLHRVHMDITSKIQVTEQVRMIEEAFKLCPQPFDGLQNKYQQEKFYVQEFNMIVSTFDFFL